MKEVAKYINLGITVIMTNAFCIFIGSKLGHITIGIFTGFILSMMYLFYNILKK
ncbi:MAG: hypothetical protein Q4B60_01740 [Erysipelotrichaceae bacterium]|nr:hypothetical protein [Erysipelotrichaceae bacterium]